jgi:hypothetical protein
VDRGVLAKAEAIARRVIDDAGQLVDPQAGAAERAGARELRGLDLLSE